MFEKRDAQFAELKQRTERLEQENENLKIERELLLNDLKNGQTPSPENQKPQPTTVAPKPGDTKASNEKISGEEKTGAAKTEVAAKNPEPNHWESMAYEKLDAPDMAYATDRSVTPDPNSPTAKAKDFLKNKNYAQAAKTLSEIKKTDGLLA